MKILKLESDMITMKTMVLFWRKDCGETKSTENAHWEKEMNAYFCNKFTYQF